MSYKKYIRLLLRDLHCSNKTKKHIVHHFDQLTKDKNRVERDQLAEEWSSSKKVYDEINLYLRENNLLLSNKEYFLDKMYTFLQCTSLLIFILLSTFVLYNVYVVDAFIKQHSDVGKTAYMTAGPLYSKTLLVCHIGLLILFTIVTIFKKKNNKPNNVDLDM